MFLVGLKILQNSLSKLKMEIYNPFALYIVCRITVHVTYTWLFVLFSSLVQLKFYSYRFLLTDSSLLL